LPQRMMSIVLLLLGPSGSSTTKVIYVQGVFFWADLCVDLPQVDLERNASASDEVARARPMRRLATSRPRTKRERERRSRSREADLSYLQRAKFYWPKNGSVTLIHIYIVNFICWWSLQPIRETWKGHVDVFINRLPETRN
jgi:hypothetical protein